MGVLLQNGIQSCPHFWVSSNGLCLDCGKQPELPHNHRFPYFKVGDTHLVCEDCRQTVYITPEQSKAYTTEAGLVQEQSDNRQIDYDRLMNGPAIEIT